VGFGEYALDVTEAIQDEIVADTESFKVRIYADGELVRELSYNDIMK
jgi:type III secretion system FlhB-like substrate exporter